MPHHCHARDCTRRVKPELLMCAPHWRMVPRRVQLLVWRHYRPGQCDDKQPSREWHVAADIAIGYVAQAEGRPLSENERAALATAGLLIL